MRRNGRATHRLSWEQLELPEMPVPDLVLVLVEVRDPRPDEPGRPAPGQVSFLEAGQEAGPPPF